MRAAIVINGEVVNVVEYDPNVPFNPGPSAEIISVDTNPQVDIGWRRSNGKFEVPLPSQLIAEPVTILANGISKSVVTYSTRSATRSGTVIFDIDGRKTNQTVRNGKATVDVTSSEAKTITVTCEGLSVDIIAVS